jgi:dihydroorotase
MSRLVITGGTVIDPAARIREPRDVLIEDGYIIGLPSKAPVDWSDAQHIDATGRWVLPGLICLRTTIGEPGEEWKEDIRTVSNAAASGGFTTLCATPNTHPINDIRAVTEQILGRSHVVGGGIRILPVGAATRGLKGLQLTEMADLKAAGCTAISSGEQAVPNAQMLRRILEYARTVGLPFFTVADDHSLAAGAVSHEGAISVRLGMKSSPSESEAISIFRDGQMSRLAEWPVHFQRVSTRAGVDTLRMLRDQNVHVSADVTPHHLWFTDEHTAGFDTDTRVSPPLRSKDDVDALRAAVAEGLIAAIATDHSPQSSVEKALEYQYATPGSTGLETALNVVIELIREKVVDVHDGLAQLTCGPADILGRSDLGRLRDGAQADVIVVDPETPKRVESERMKTKSRNCIFEGVSLTGEVETTIVAGMVYETD